MLDIPEWIRQTAAQEEMLTLLTAGTTTAEKAVIMVARRHGIKCAGIKPRPRGPRRGYKKCLFQNAVDADGTIVLGDKLVPGSREVEVVLDANKPASLISMRVSLMFPSGVADVLKWIRKHKIKKLHVTGRAPKAMTVKFLRAVLAPR